jgi:hypothetical protein
MYIAKKNRGRNEEKLAGRNQNQKSKVKHHIPNPSW